ncbi:MAG: 3-phosphoshikimate 1-carboxyvinyltransferase [bacterium]|nr:3-phosphoshikimate 1-carboxyvinyltransferase [bacterium]
MTSAPDDSADSLKISRRATIAGEVRLPGSKSIANRALLLSALARGRTRVSNLPIADDVQILIQTLPQLGIEVSLPAGGEADSGSQAAGVSAGDRLRSGTVTDLEIAGAAGPFAIERGEINVENAGTAFRPLTALLAAGNGDFVIDGNAQMRERPIRDLVDGLRELGVDIECEANGCPPVRLRARGLPGGAVTMSGKVSSQYISAVLMASPFARQADLTIDLPAEPVSKPYIDLTIDMMADFGVMVGREGYRHFRTAAGQSYHSPGQYLIEGDASAATYFLGAGALPGCGPVRVLGLGRDSRQGDVAFAELLREMGATVTYGDGWIETRGASASRLRAIDRDMNDMPDAAMTAAVLALFADGESHIRNIENLRVKESERIRGLRLELEKLGATVREESDALHITPPEDGLRPARIETYKDHRMAMAFALAAFGTDLEILDPGCVAKTYTRFFEDFLPLTQAHAVS